MAVWGENKGDGTGVFGWHRNTSSAGGYGGYFQTSDPAMAWGAYVVGDFNVSGTTYNFSDRRFKKNIQSIDNVLPRLNQLKVRTYQMNTEAYPGLNYDADKTNFGFIAQEIEKIFPELVNNTKSVPDPGIKLRKGEGIKSTSGYYMVDYQSLIPILVKAIQEQQVIIDSLKKEINDSEKMLEFKKELDKLRSEIELLKSTIKNNSGIREQE